MECNNHSHHHCHGVTVINPCCCHGQGESGGVQREQVRIKLMEATTFYLRHEGDDANDGLTPEMAFKTWGGLIDGLTAYDFNRQTVTIDFGPGTWTGEHRFWGNNFGAIGNTVFRGAGRGATIIDAAGGYGFYLTSTMSGGGLALITGLTIENHLYGIFGTFTAMFDVDDVEFARCVSGGFNIRLYLYSRYIHFGDANQSRHVYVTDCSQASHIYASTFSEVALTNHVIHLSGANNWTTGFIGATKGSVVNVSQDKFSVTGSGTAVGRRYHLNYYSYAVGTRNNQTLFPGDQAGLVDAATYALYLH